MILSDLPPRTSVHNLILYNHLAGLDKDEFVVGRQSSCDYHFESGESQSKIYPLISKIHFIIEKHVIRGTCVAFLKDVSSNGTFVNDQLVGRDQRHVLSNDDVISVGKVGYQREFF